jgi:hypothetical protein
MKIEGIPEGYELVRIGHLSYSDQYLGAFGDILIWDNKVQSTSCSHVILRKIKRPKQYRPFANAEEFKSHRDRWVRRISDGLTFRCSSYGGGVLVVYANILPTFSEAFEQFVFDDDGTPFGVEVSE